MKPYTFEEVLADKEGKKIIEAIEHVDNNPQNPDDLNYVKSLIKDLKEKFNFDYGE